MYLDGKAPAIAHCVGHHPRGHRSFSAGGAVVTKVVETGGLSRMGIAVFGPWGKSCASAPGSARRSKPAVENQEGCGVGRSGGVIKNRQNDMANPRAMSRATRALSQRSSLCHRRRR